MAATAQSRKGSGNGQILTGEREMTGAEMGARRARNSAQLVTFHHGDGHAGAASGEAVVPLDLAGASVIPEMAERRAVVGTVTMAGSNLLKLGLQLLVLPVLARLL